MEKKKSMSARARGNSFVHAFRGISIIMKEPNTVLHAIITVIVIGCGFARQLNGTNWIAIIFAIGLVWVTEAINTCIERLCDHSCEGQFHPAIKIIKDVAAGAVLLAAITSAAIGVIVFFF
jgi:diacylglycerol kinase